MEVIDRRWVPGGTSVRMNVPASFESTPGPFSSWTIALSTGEPPSAARTLPMMTPVRTSGSAVVTGTMRTCLPLARNVSFVPARMRVSASRTVRLSHAHATLRPAGIMSGL